MAATILFIPTNNLVSVLCMCIEIRGSQQCFFLFPAHEYIFFLTAAGLQCSLNFFVYEASHRLLRLIMCAMQLRVLMRQEYNDSSHLIAAAMRPYSRVLAGHWLSDRSSQYRSSYVLTFDLCVDIRQFY